MFLEELLPEERVAFIELAALIAGVDGNLSVYEHSILEKYKKEMDLKNYQIKGWAMEEILNTFKTKRAKTIVLTELFQLIFSDGILHEQENVCIRQIKKHFGFDEKEFQSFKDWVDRIKELSNELGK
ncbi:TerB family tellurite resistance protein [Neobacillus sedimentimangrovi]|uniref:TerB family tellurite resistance protein n=1 Tax=Neobacillus sedimentimangrovi TaxID=2699460 RepID=A0ABS8QE33_9BACI|nr:TerB family tellurite resistance protein [Neobacillus sedimentimangrovi]MCD4837515.1 TerB family tellurite resistance protein [Neobacillus sedimentimangrovi]